MPLARPYTFWFPQVPSSSFYYPNLAIFHVVHHYLPPENTEFPYVTLDNPFPSLGHGFPFFAMKGLCKAVWELAMSGL